MSLMLAKEVREQHLTNLEDILTDMVEEINEAVSDALHKKKCTAVICAGNMNSCVVSNMKELLDTAGYSYTYHESWYNQPSRFIINLGGKS